LKIFTLGQKSLANATGTADLKNHRFAAALEEHSSENRYAHKNNYALMSKCTHAATLHETNVSIKTTTGRPT
jgi:hypothetical protein